MARYRKLLALEITHEYLRDTVIPGLRYVPTADCAELMEQEGLLWRALPSGVELWQEQREVASATEWQLGLDVYSSDPSLRFYTAWPQQAYLDVSAGQQDAARVLRLAAQPAPAEARGPVLWLDLACGLIEGADVDAAAASVRPWQVALRARQIHWKYFFSGGLAGKPLSIIDLDASDSEPGIRFAPSPLAATANGTAYLSASPLPMQSIPRQRLQLREAGTAGKVLIRRLPNASVDKLGKEQGPNGQSMIVAEIYVHQ
ncbi:hypothetical protein GJ699_06985 [Duganella sp. FT80W]|uniref:Uncharacterized protein n=1 Tax=Duganella guangzhouensis TaxID=2666084 RepID=A0A6I2KV88_9BURK|nr:hypothetical protein [Duganella guangzhouensis]MRW89723.1 hypothetical protein [Duganella guangzhouensis]